MTNRLVPQGVNVEYAKQRGPAGIRYGDGLSGLQIRQLIYNAAGFVIGPNAGAPLPVVSANLVAQNAIASEIGSWDPVTGLFTVGVGGAGDWIVRVAAQLSQDNATEATLDTVVNGNGTIFQPLPIAAAGLAISDAVIGVSAIQLYELAAGDTIGWTIDTIAAATDVTVHSFTAELELVS